MTNDIQSDCGKPVAIERSDRGAAAREIEAFIVRNPDVLGGADIYCLDFANAQVRAGILVAVLSGLSDEHRRPAIRRYLVIAPPGSDDGEWLDAIWGQFVTTFTLLAGREMDEREACARRAMLQVAVAADLHHRSALELLAAQPDRTAVIVGEASRYRDDGVKAYIAPGARTPVRVEDVWAPQVHALAAAAAGVVADRTVYAAIDAGELLPTRTELQQLLESINACGVMGSSSDDDPETILTQHVDQWAALVAEGRLGAALREVDALPAVLDRHKPFLRIQLMSQGKHFVEAIAAVRDMIALGRDLDPVSRTKLARVAQDANASALAIELLGPAITQLDSLEFLQSALATAQDANAPALVERAAEKLASLFPNSPDLQELRLNELLAALDYGSAASFAREEMRNHQAADFYDVLGRYLSMLGVPDYGALINEAGGDASLSDAFRMACVNDALGRSLPVHAFELAFPLPKTKAQQARGERLLLRTLREIVLERARGGAWPVDEDRFAEAVMALVTSLAADPARHELRLGLVELLQPAVAGTTGQALAAWIALRLSARPIALRKREAPGKAGMDWLLEKKQFLNSAFTWMTSEQPIVIGRLPLPTELLTEPADEVLSAVAKFLTHAPTGGDGDDETLNLFLALGCAVAPHSSDPDYDLRLIRLAAGKLASAGAGQAARDLAEQALTASLNTARRRRLGWFAMADTYARQGNIIEALLAMACTFAADVEGDQEEIYQEITGLARILRDCGLLSDARLAVGRARQLLEAMEITERFGHQLDTLELQIRQRHPDASGGSGFKVLLADATEHGRDVLRRGGPTAPSSALLGQLLRTARLRGVPVADDVDVVMEGLRERAGGGLEELVGTMAAERPTSGQLLNVARSGGFARYSDDVGFDTRHIALLASRALGGDQMLGDPVGTSFALELLADRGVALPDWDEAAAPPDPPASAEESAEIARQISRAGINVIQVGFDDEGRLVRLSTVGGKTGTPVREAETVISQSRFREWARHFPYAYGIDETTANLFYTTTADLRLSELPTGPTVIVAEAELQGFPPNLLFVNDEFAGRAQPMAAAPSLAWLDHASGTGLIGDGRMCAWISTAEGDEAQTLPMIAQRLGPTFLAHGFHVDNSARLPVAFAGATMAVVTAHGSVNSEGRYFQMVSDEGILRVTAGDLANALRNVGVVILFICSAGRADKHPAANTALGLSKQIIDRGCTSVVASPWPIDARVPSHWLPTFLDSWAAGSTVMQATFDANKVADRAFAQDPARGLAMTVYGNPLVAKA